MFDPNVGRYHVRKWYTQVEDVLATETGMAADGTVLRRFVIAAAVRNPLAGGFEQSLTDIVEGSDELGRVFGERALAAAGGVPIQSYGKACLVGADGEYEQGNAFLTQVFADPVRKAIGGGKSWVPSTGKVGGLGAALDIPLAHKDALYVRANYDTVTVCFADAPRADEVLVAFAFATRGRLHARLGGLTVEDVIGQDGLR